LRALWAWHVRGLSCHHRLDPVLRKTRRRCWHHLPEPLSAPDHHVLVRPGDEHSYWADRPGHWPARADFGLGYLGVAGLPHHQGLRQRAECQADLSNSSRSNTERQGAPLAFFLPMRTFPLRFEGESVGVSY